jgi:hypothetical protein
MLTNGFPAEVKRLCSLICSDARWFIWLHSRAEAHFISPEELRFCSVEERVLLKNLGQAHSDGSFSLPESHVLHQFIGAGGQRLLFLHGHFGETTVLLALPAQQELLLEKIVLLISDRWREWQLKQQLSRLVEQQQQQLHQAEERYRSLYQQREEQVRQLLQRWADEQSPALITFHESIYTRFDFSLSDLQIRQQLDNALQLVQFIQPENPAFQLSAAHIQPMEQPVNSTVNVPLSANQRVELLLDKYEASARIAQQKGLVVNGKTIAEHLQPSISPPAITDALKKNRKAIGNLLEQYPEKWNLLRKYLKPVKELSEHAFYKAFDASSLL